CRKSEAGVGLLCRRAATAAPEPKRGSQSVSCDAASTLSAAPQPRQLHLCSLRRLLQAHPAQFADQLDEFVRLLARRHVGRLLSFPSPLRGRSSLWFFELSVVCTVTAGLEKVFSPDLNVGFVSHALKYGDAIAA